MTFAIRRRITPADRIVFSFLALIFAGTLALHLPVCSAGEEKIKLRDCLFTATSAVCVTGLTVVDTGTEFSFTGQVIILFLIQLGGLGILTFSNWFILSLHGNKSDPATRMLLSQSHGTLPYLQPSSMLRQIFAYTFLCEAIGAGLLLLRFSRDLPFGEALWSAVFHSVSAFCNAGFSLFRDSLVQYRAEPVVNFTVILLILLGGIGFVVSADLHHFVFAKPQDKRRRQLAYHSKVVLLTTSCLILLGFTTFLVLEWRNTLADLPLGEKLLASLFLSVTPRTAGYNTLDTAALTNTTLFLTIILMGIGGSPGSTAGGIKVTTFAVLIGLIWSRSRARSRIELLGRSVPLSVVSKSVAVGSAYGLLTLLSVALMELFETHGLGPAQLGAARGLFIQHLFEIVSALGTVGLSTGVTPDLEGSSHILLVVLMLLGRLGPLLFAESLIGNRKPPRYSLPEDYVMVG